MTEKVKNKSKPVFYYSYAKPLTSYLILSILFLLVFGGAIEALAVFPSLFFGILDLLLIASALRCYFRPVRRAWFFEDNFRIVGPNTLVELGYAEIKQVTKLKVLPLVSPFSQIQIVITGDKSFVVPADPSNRARKTDLYSWLVSKTSPTQFSAGQSST
jgi:hypothetical protein